MKDGRPAIMLCVPVTDMIPGLFLGFFGAIVTAFAYRGWYVGHSISDGMPLDRARANILLSVINSPTEYDFMLWIDSDMFLTDTHAVRLIQYLLDNPDVDGATGLYFQKGGQYPPTTFKAIEDVSRSCGYRFERFLPGTGAPEPVDAVGLGCVAIRMSFIREKLLPKMKMPWKFFWFEGPIGEDLNFFGTLKKFGFKMMVLPDVEVPHLGATVQRWHHEMQLKGKTKDLEPDYVKKE